MTQEQCPDGGAPLHSTCVIIFELPLISLHADSSSSCQVQGLLGCFSINFHLLCLLLKPSAHTWKHIQHCRRVTGCGLWTLAGGLDACTHLVSSVVWAKHPVLTNHISRQQVAGRAPVLTVYRWRGPALPLCQRLAILTVVMPNRPFSDLKAAV